MGDTMSDPNQPANGEPNESETSEAAQPQHQPPTYAPPAYQPQQPTPPAPATNEQPVYQAPDYQASGYQAPNPQQQAAPGYPAYPNQQDQTAPQPIIPQPIVPGMVDPQEVSTQPPAYDGQQPSWQQPTADQAAAQAAQPPAAPEQNPYGQTGQYPGVDATGQQPQAPQYPSYGQPASGYQTDNPQTSGYPTGAYPAGAYPTGAYPTTAYPTAPDGSPQYATAPGAPGGPGYPAGPGFPPAQNTPPKKKRTGMLIGIIGGGALLVILVIAGIIFFATESASHAPEASVKTYLNALKSGDVAQVLKLGGTKTSNSDVLLTEKAYKQATNKVTAFTVDNGLVSGDNAIVRATLKQSSGTSPVTFQLVKNGTDFGIFPKWELSPVAVGTTRISVNAPDDATVQVGGVSVKPDKDGTIGLRALPGTYPVTFGSNQYYTAKAASSTINGLGSTSLSEPVTMAATITEAGTKAATDAVNAYFNNCVASTSLSPQGCPIGLSNASDFTNVANVKWTVVTAPQFTIDSTWSDGWAVDTTTPGSVDMTATATDSSGATGQLGLIGGPQSVSLGGSVEFSSSGAKYTPSLQDLLNNF
jgi:hypothetical protein